MKRRTLMQAAAAGVAVFSKVTPAIADGVYRIVTGFPPGGSVDLVARPLVEQLRALTGKTWTVDTRAGAGGQLAANFVKDQPADGSTLLLTPALPITMYPHTYKRLPYDPAKDLVPVAAATSYQFALAVGPGVPASVTNVATLKQWLLANPGQANFGSPAAGSSPHMVGLLLGREFGVDLRHVGYRGGGPLAVDLAGGSVPVGITPISDVIRFVESGKVRLLAVTGKSRSALYPHVPTFVELGIAKTPVDDWHGLFLPKGASAATVASTIELVQKAMRSPSFTEVLGRHGLETGTRSGSDFAKLVQEETLYWGDVVKSVGFKAED